MTIVNKGINIISQQDFIEYIFSLCLMRKNFYLLQFSVYIQYYLPVLTVFLDE